MISRIHTRWLRIGIALPVVIGLIGGLTWALRPRTEPETAQLARRELQEAIRQLDLFLQTYPATPDEAQGALERARSAFEKAAGHLALSQASGVRQRQADFHQLQDLTAARAAPEVVLPLARQLREALQRMLEP
ncbi:MAG TPA: hypothetical protein VNK89_00610 [Thermoflexus sp.]|nr:hypothetical protein [Thermoflexus sp.]